MARKIKEGKKMGPTDIVMRKGVRKIRKHLNKHHANIAVPVTNPEDMEHKAKGMCSKNFKLLRNCIVSTIIDCNYSLLFFTFDFVFFNILYIESYLFQTRPNQVYT